MNGKLNYVLRKQAILIKTFSFTILLQTSVSIFRDYSLCYTPRSTTFLFWMQSRPNRMFLRKCGIPCNRIDTSPFLSSAREIRKLPHESREGSGKRSWRADHQLMRLKKRSFRRERVSRRGIIQEFPHCVHTLSRGTNSPRETVVTHSRFIIKGGNLRRGVFVGCPPKYSNDRARRNASAAVGGSNRMCNSVDRGLAIRFGPCGESRSVFRSSHTA